MTQPPNKQSNGNARSSGSPNLSVETSEAAISAVEDQFPLTSGVAFAKARERVLEAGDSVLQAEKDVLYEVFPNGSRRRVKALQPSVHVDTGRKLRIT